MCSAERVSEQDGRLLLGLAGEAIERELHHLPEQDLLLQGIPEHLWQEGAAFVTLNLHGKLRGCIGHLQASQPLVEDVVQNARHAAFRDPRFAPLTDAEFPELEISLSLLSSSEPLNFSSEEDLLRQLRPGIDGLILQDGAQRGTFLPSVWESLPDPADFLRQLKLKAGLPADSWSDSLIASRYTTQHIA